MKAHIAKNIELKRYRKKRFNARQEVTRQLRLRNNLEKDTFTKLRGVINRNVRIESENYANSGRFANIRFIRNLNNDINELMYEQLIKVFRETINLNIETYDEGIKNLEFISFNKPLSFQSNYDRYFSTRSPLYTNIAQSTAMRVDLFLSDNQNLSLADQAKGLRGNMYGFSRTRAMRIARTETHSASSFASDQYNDKVSKELGIPMKKRWVSVGDARTRLSHANANGQIRDMEEDFEINGALMKHPGDPKGGAKNVVNCRCVVVYVDDEDLDLIEDTKPVKPVADAPRQDSFDWEFENGADSNKFNNQFFLNNGTKDTQEVVRKTRGVVAVKKGNHSYYYGRNNDITMNRDYTESGGAFAVVWRHEFGHRIDNVAGANLLKDRFVHLRRKFGLEAGEYADVAFLNYISGLGIKNSFIKDRKRLLKKNKENDKKYRDLEISNTELAKDLGIEEVRGTWVSEITGREFAKVGYKYTIPIEEAERRLKKYLKGSQIDFDDIKTIWGDDFMKEMYTATDDRLQNFMHWARNTKYNFYRPYDVNTFELNTKGMTLNFKKELLMFEDFLGSLTNAKYYEGHGASYYRKHSKFPQFRGWTKGHTSEMMANYTALIGGPNSALWRKYLERYAPDSLKFFDELFEELAKVQGGIDK